MRNPKSIRPWQHVLEPLNGYLMLGEKLINKEKDFCSSFNFGPESSDVRSVLEMSEIAKKSWEKINAQFVKEENAKHEAGLLKLDITKAKEILNWKPVLNSEQATDMTINWYKNFYETKNLMTEADLLAYSKLLSK
jgi:CDP-glucose 4,6-dehydratase